MLKSPEIVHHRFATTAVTTHDLPEVAEKDNAPASDSFCGSRTRSGLSGASPVPAVFIVAWGRRKFTEHTSPSPSGDRL